MYTILTIHDITRLTSHVTRLSSHIPRVIRLAALGVGLGLSIGKGQNCDANQDGRFDVLDVQTVIASLGSGTPLSVRGKGWNGGSSIDDVIISVASALVGECTIANPQDPREQMEQQHYVARDVPDPDGLTVQHFLVCRKAWSVAYYVENLDSRGERIPGPNGNGRFHLASPVHRADYCYSDSTELLSRPGWREWYDGLVSALTQDPTATAAAVYDLRHGNMWGKGTL